jgi:hypothetical protein
MTMPRTRSAATALALLALCAALPLAAQVGPAPDTIASYSQVLPLTVSGKDAVFQLRLPQAVYLHARSSTLDDLRVFDARGTALPFALVQPVSQTQTSYRKLPVKVFPVFAADGADQQNLAQLDIRVSADGTLVSVNSRTGAGVNQSAVAPLRSLVLDLRRADAPAIDALTFTLPAGVTNYSAQVELDVSDDLNTWETIATTSLNWLVNREVDSLASDRIEFGARAFRYARVRWHEGNPIQFASIVADAPALTAAAPKREQLLIAPRPGKFVNDLLYQAAPAIPVQAIGVQFSDTNVVMPATLGQYVELPNRQAGAATRFDFRPTLHATFFSLNQGGKLRASGDVSVDQIHAAQWVLRPQNASTSQPSLRLTWTPATMIFTASGNAPYRLAFGREQAPAAQQPLSQVAPGFADAELHALPQATPGQLQTQLAGADDAPSVAAKAAAEARQRKLVLWGVLLLGLCVLVAMSWRLIRQMKTAPP